MARNMFTLQGLTPQASQTIVLPRECILLGVSMLFVSTATGGDRLLIVEVTNEADILMARFVAGAVVAASLLRTVYFGGSVDDTAFVNKALRVAMGPNALPRGWKVKCRDLNDVDSSGDLMSVALAAQD